MKQLSSTDVGFLVMETSTTFGHVSSLNIYDPTTAPGGGGYEATKKIILERIDLLQPFRRRLVEVPFGMDLPYWIEDPNFDIDFHVRHHAVPPPGTPEQLAEIVSRIIARPLDRSRPLWELYVIEGVDNGRRIAQLTKIHHATIDGAAGALMLAAILDVDPNFRPTGPPAQWAPDIIPTDQEMLRLTAGEFLRRPEKVIRQSVRAFRELAVASQNGGLRALADIVAQPLPGAVGSFMRKRLRGDAPEDLDRAPALPFTAAPRTPWNQSITPHRRFAYTSIPLEQAKKIRRAHGVTFNDVVMALCSGVLRNYLLAHDCLPEEPLIAMVPVSIRTGDEEDIYQNRVSALLSNLATNEPDPLRRLKVISASMNAAKEGVKAMPAEVLTDFGRFAPPAIAARAMRMASRLKIADRMNPPFNLIISNVPGPNHKLYSAGAELRHFYPVSTITDGQGLNMTVQSYNGSLDFGFVACRELVPDLWSMVDLLHLAMEELLATIPAAPSEPEAITPKKTPARKPGRQKPPATKKAVAKQ
jgi:diacylglycerol O-acyltransferase / wax synthase